MTDFKAVPKVVGLKQTLKKIKDGSAERVIIAKDSDQFIVNEIETACEGTGIPVLSMSNKRSLGKACGIERPAAVIALLGGTEKTSDKNETDD